MVEIDLLRDGDRSVLGWRANDVLSQMDRTPEYLAVVTRGYLNYVGGDAYLFPAPIDRPLPTIPCPLREGDEDIPVLLQEAFDRVYDVGPFRRRVEYDKDCFPPLPADRLDWSIKLRQEKGYAVP